MTQPEPLAPLVPPHTPPSPISAAVHGGPDALGVPSHDFSTNSNACGPCPQALLAVQTCDASRYPDPAYTTLRQKIADFHGVAVWRVVLAGSASEFIYRITAWVARQGGRQVSVPQHSYGDYAHAAKAWGLALGADANSADLVWCCEPSSPLGGPHGQWPHAIDAPPTESPTTPSSPLSSPSPSPTQPPPATVVLELKPALYHAGPDVMLAVLQHAKADTVMMIGHNPGISEFAARLAAHPPVAPEFARYPTGATLVVDFVVDSWTDVGFGLGAVVDFIVPREIMA